HVKWSALFFTCAHTISIGLSSQCHLINYAFIMAIFPFFCHDGTYVYPGLNSLQSEIFILKYKINTISDVLVSYRSLKYWTS
ncbi:hypothetical protein L9F63_023032, partial [Diploptera punctata]